MIFSTINLAYIVAVKPMSSRVENNIEIFNECCILGSTYVLNVFINVAAPASLVIKMGWVSMGIAFINIISNIFFAGVSMLYELLEQKAV